MSASCYMHSEHQDQLQVPTHVIQCDTWWTYPHPYGQDYLTSTQNFYPCAQSIVASFCECSIVAR